jgi:hypothetical protein
MKNLKIVALLIGSMIFFSQGAIAATPFQMGERQQKSQESFQKFLEQRREGSFIERISERLVEGSNEVEIIFSDSHFSNRFNEARRARLEKIINLFPRFGERLEARGLITIKDIGLDGTSPSGGSTAVPIPATVWLFCSALGFLGWKSRKQNPASMSA